MVSKRKLQTQMEFEFKKKCNCHCSSDKTRDSCEIISKVFLFFLCAFALLRFVFTAHS